MIRKNAKGMTLVGRIMAGKLEIEALISRAIPELVRQREIIDGLLNDWGYKEAGGKRTAVAARRVTPAEKNVLTTRVMADLMTDVGGVVKRPRAGYNPDKVCPVCHEKGHDARRHFGGPRKAKPKQASPKKPATTKEAKPKLVSKKVSSPKKDEPGHVPGRAGGIANAYKPTTVCPKCHETGHDARKHRYEKK